MASKYRNKYQKTYSFSSYLFIGVLVVMVGVTMYFANFLIQKNQTLTVGASAGTANLFFEPAAVTLPPDGLVNLWITADKPVGFVSAELAFDKTLIKLVQEVTLPATIQERVVKLTSMAEANSTGKISVVVGIDPGSLTTAPTGNFALAALKFSTITTSANKTTTLAVGPGNLQLIDTGSTPFVVTTQTANFTLNPVASPSLTPSPSIIPSPSPSPSASPISTLDLTGPSLTLTTGKLLGRTWVTAKATDNSGVGTISLAFASNQVILKTCNNKTSCTYYPSTKYVTPYDILVTAIDKSQSQNISKGIITVK